MKKWLKEKKLIWMFSLLAGLVVGLSVNFYELSRPIAAQEKSGVFYPIERKIDVVDDASYWRGKVDAKLSSIDEKMREFAVQIQKLNVNLTEVKVQAAKDGSIYGGVTSFIILLFSLIMQGVFKVLKNGKRR